MIGKARLLRGRGRFGDRQTRIVVKYARLTLFRNRTDKAGKQSTPTEPETGDQTEQGQGSTLKKYGKIIGGGFLVGGGTMIATPLLLSAAGFKTTGVAAGSLAALLMSTGAKGISGGALTTGGSIVGGLYVAGKIWKTLKKIKSNKELVLH
ncbi:interferon alpha-inducible protein 27-like protein 2B [Ostrea edulis]|uniref:interferon alpha-inducible protein 27-like protein 2B n=1 Tax=Ostrea edulis TaxID=37623 RepID=UPI0024AF8B5F|nr:interferon alpha-inducible protein 27-like protein 2B [Ostrea edulis]